MRKLEARVQKCYEGAPFPDNLRKAKNFNAELQRNIDWVALNLKFLSESLIRSKPRTILCAGCGTGEEALSLAKIFPKSKINAIDISSTSLAIAKKNARKAKVNNISFQKISIIDGLPRIKGKYDLVFSLGVVHHLSDPRLGFKILRSKVEKRGSLVVMLYNSYGLFFYRCQLWFLNLIAKASVKRRLAFVKLLKLGKGRSKAYIYDTYINPQVTTLTINTVRQWGEEENLEVVGIVPPLNISRLIEYGTEGKRYYFRRKGVMSFAFAVSKIISKVLPNKRGGKNSGRLRMFCYQLLFLILGRGECQYLFKARSVDP